MSEYIENFRAALEAFTDERFASRQDLYDLAMFHLYLVNLAENDGWQYDGHSWKESAGLGCLVVKATVDGIPSVVFTNAHSSTIGIRIFLRKLDAGILEWVKDRYRG